MPKGRKRYQGLRHTSSELQRKGPAEKMQRTCGNCPVKQTCKFNISAGFYYVGGRLVPERLRVEPKCLHEDMFHAYENSGGAHKSKRVRFAQVRM